MSFERAETKLPAPPRRARRRDWGRVIARFLCVLLAVLGLLPLGLASVARSPWARGWATRETTRILAEQNVHATYGIDLKLWPLSVELTQIQVEANDGAGPAFAAKRLAARPRFFGLLSGKLVIEEIELDAPHARLVMREGKIANLDVKLPESKGGAFRSPFSVFAVSDGVVDLDVDGMRLSASDIDLDVTADSELDVSRGSSFEIALSVGQAAFHRSRLADPEGDGTSQLVFDDDSFCAVDARVRIAPDMVLVRRLDAVGSADLDGASEVTPQCNLPAADKRRVELALNHLRVRLPEKTGDMPRVDGHAHVRLPPGLGQRAGLPEVDGWVGFTGDVRYGPDTVLPDLSGHLEGHGLRLDVYNFAQEIQTDITIKQNIVTTPMVTVRIADGVVSIADVTVEPLAKGIPIRAKFDAKDVSFTTLVRNLGVAQNPHVTWDLREIHVPLLKGTIVPLNIDGEVSAKTGNFAVYDSVVENPGRIRMIGVREAAVNTHVGIRPDAVQFSNASAILPTGSKLTGGFVSLGFHSIIKVDAPKGTVDLKDIGPLGDIVIGGVAEVDAHVFGTFSDPHLAADVSIANFVLGDIPFGSVTAGHVTLTGLVVDLTNVKAIKGKSDYEMPTARLDFGGPAGMTMDAMATSTALSARDFFGIFKLDEDPRFAEIDASIGTRSSIHIALGGPEDVCGGGFINVHSSSHLKDVLLYGERFEDGDLDLDYKSTDRLAGLEGADVEVRAATLHKVRKGKGAYGSLLASASIQRGGGLNGSIVIEALPLSRVDTLGPLARQLEGSVSGIAQVSGRLEAFSITSEVDVTPVRFRGASLGSSHLRVGMTQKAPEQVGTPRLTRCKGRIAPAFNREAYFKDTSSQGDYIVDGDLFGGQVALSHVTMSRQKAAIIKGGISLRQVSLNAVGKMLAFGEEGDKSLSYDDAPPPPDMGGEISGELTIEHLAILNPSTARVRFVPKSLTIDRAGQKLALRPVTTVITVDNDTLTVPPLGFNLVANGLQGSFTLRGTAAHLTRDADLAMVADLAPIDLGLLVGVVPKLERAVGTLSGSLKVAGHLSSPAVDGELKVRGGEFAVHGLPSVISEVEVDIRADASEVRVTRATARFAGGTVQISDAHVPIRALALGIAEATVEARGIHLAPSEGVTATFDADLTISHNPNASGGARARLPHVTGDVLITALEYNRSINLLNDLAGGFRVGGAKRTVVDSYDPSLDAVDLELHVRSRVPLRMKNNLVEVQFRIDSGVLTVTGTNQRPGLRGDLKAVPGGRFHLFANEFEIRQAFIRFDDATRIAPNIDIVAVTEYRRYTDTSSGATAGAGATAGRGAGSGRTGGLWRISMHAFGDADNVRFEMTSDPALAQEDIFFLLTVGLTRSEVAQVQAGSVGASIAFEAVGTATGADRAVKTAIPVIDDFRFGSAYSSRTGRSEPQVTVGRRITESVRASVTSGLTEDRELRSNIEWRLNKKFSVQGSYDNVNDVSSSAVGNVGVDFRWRLEFE